MASVFRCLPLTQISCRSHHQHGSSSPCLSPFHQKAHVKMYGVPFCIAKAQLVSIVSTEKLQENGNVIADNTEETLDMAVLVDVPELPSKFPHLSQIIAQLLAGINVGLVLDPWLCKLSVEEWNHLLRESGEKDSSLPLQISALLREKRDVVDQAIFSQNGNEDEASSSEVSHGGSTVRSEEASQNEDKGIFMASTTDLQKREEEKEEKEEKEMLKQSMKTVTPTLKLHTTLVRMLRKNNKIEEIDQVQMQMREAGIEPDGLFYNAVLDAYLTACLLTKVPEVLAEMRRAGFEPEHSTYEKLAYVYMKEKDPDLDVPREVVRELMGRGLPVSAGVFKGLVKACWEAKDTAGAEEAFEAMQTAGHTPDLKVLLKLMQLNGRRGNHERVKELLELTSKLGLQPNASAYEYLLHAYCKAGQLDKAKETFMTFESIVGSKPSLIASNMLIDGYGKQGLFEEALEVFEGIGKKGMRRTFVSYSSIISAMAQVGKFDKAEQLYKRMSRDGVQPNLHTYLTMIRCYTKSNQTREGHKVYNAMRKAPIEMTDVAYSAALTLYVEGTWYQHAAALLREIEDKGVVLDAAATSALIRSFSILERNLTPLARVIQESNMDICKLMNSLFQATIERKKLEPNLEEAVFLLLDKWKEANTNEAKSLVPSAFMDYFWKKGYRGVAKKILEDFSREVYAGYSRPRIIGSVWILDVTGLGVGGAKAAVSDWLLDAGEGFDVIGGEDIRTMVVVTGDEFGLTIAQDNFVVKQVISLWLKELDSPFVLSPDDPKQMEAGLVDALTWVSRDDVKTALQLGDSCSL